MGRRKDGQERFFYAFDLDKVVPSDHLVRQIDGALDLSWVHKELVPYYSHTGRPSIDPVLMIRMLLVGYVFAIRSERRICAEVQVNLAYRWFCKLGIEDQIPDHSVFCRARHERFRESDALRRVFEGVVAMWRGADQHRQHRSRPLRLLQGQQERLFCLRLESQVHDGGRAQGHPRPQRRCA